METIRFRLQTYEFKMETGWFKLVQIQSGTKKTTIPIIRCHFPLIGSKHVHQEYRAVIILQNTFNIFLQNRERNLMHRSSKSQKAGIYV